MSRPCSFFSIVFAKIYGRTVFFPRLSAPPVNKHSMGSGRARCRRSSGVVRNHVPMYSFFFFFQSFLSAQARVCRSERVHARACVCVCLHTSVWKSPSDESGVLAEDESQFLLCSSNRSFCSPGTMDSSGVMVLKLSHELWSSGVDLSWWRRKDKEMGRVCKERRRHIEDATEATCKLWFNATCDLFWWICTQYLSVLITVMTWCLTWQETPHILRQI